MSTEKSTTTTKPSHCKYDEEDLTLYCIGRYHPVRVGDYFAEGRYEVLLKIGYGLYSTVWLARDTKENRHVALKVLRADSYGGDQEIFELDILKHVQAKDPSDPGVDHIVGFEGHFRHQGPHGEHVCLIFKAMGPDLATYRTIFPTSTLPVETLKRVTEHLLQALDYLHRTCGVINTDIKPGNILVETSAINLMIKYAPSSDFREFSKDCSNDFYINSNVLYDSLYLTEEDPVPEGFSVRLADFGTASWDSKHLTEWIQPEKLRAPEVILGADWNSSVDIWNLGCLIWELAEPTVLFDGRSTRSAPYSEEAHLAQMEGLFGLMPKSLLARSKDAPLYYDEKGRRRSQITFPGVSMEGFMKNPELTGREKSNFLKLLNSMLKLNPEERPSARELLNSEWLSNIPTL